MRNTRVATGGGVLRVSLGERLRKARALSGLTQKQAAGAVGVSRSSLNMYERDERDPDSQTLSRLAQVYRVSADWLLGTTDDPTPPRLTKRLSPRERLQRAGAMLRATPGLTDEDVDEILRYVETRRKIRQALEGDEEDRKGN